MNEPSMMNYFKEELIKLNVSVSNHEEAFQYISEWLVKSKYVKESFYDALVKREEEFPTGLHTGTIDLAIPHTDPKHILKPFIAILRLNNEVKFKEMGSLEGEVKLQLLFVIGFDKGEEQLIILQNLMKLFKSKLQMQRIMETNNEIEILEILKNNL